ncbi:MAG: DUF3830 family protein [Hungateiclostridium thermocellum]|nr:DUF3830 family protein [Acetivibrio thermocellus]
MVNNILLEWKEIGVKVRAKLLNDKAPKFCAELENLLPFDSIQGHTVISGQNMSIPMKLMWLEREYDIERKTGNLFIYTNGQRIVIPYGVTNEPGLVNTFAEVWEEDLKELEKAGISSRTRLLTGITEPQIVTVSALD